MAEQIPGLSAEQAEGARELARHLALVRGFGFYLVVVEYPGEAIALRTVLPAIVKDAGGGTGRLKELDTFEIDPQQIFQDAGAYDLVIIDASAASGPDLLRWEGLFRRLNQARNIISHKAPCPLVLIVPRSLYAPFARAAPDLWSIRSFVFDIPKKFIDSQVESGFGKVLPPRMDPNTRKELDALLRSLFSASELRRFLRHLPGGVSLVDELPEEPVGLGALAHEAVELLVRMGMIDTQFFDSLISARERRSSEIEAVAQLWKISKFSAISSPAPAEPVGIERARERLRTAELRNATVHVQQARGAVQDALSEIHGLPKGEPDVKALHREAQSLLEHLGYPGVRTETLIVLASYNPEESLPGRSIDARFYRPYDALDREDWERYFGGGLVAFRGQLASTGQNRILLYPSCLPSVAMRAGLVFHRYGGFFVSCIQNNPAAGRMDTWDLTPSAISEIAHREVSSKLSDEPDPQEIHLLISIAQTVVPGWRRWRDAVDMPAIRIHLHPNPGTSSLAIRDTPGALAFAHAAAAEVRRVHAEHPLPLRVFFSGPNALAVALGRELHGLGKVSLMDWDPKRERYVTSFVVDANAG